MVRHQGTVKHVAEWWGVDAVDVRAAVEQLRPEAEAMLLEAGAHLSAYNEEREGVQWTI
jgi:hypothetical protein